MSHALGTWRKKLDYLQQQEGIVSDPGQKFTLAEQIREAKAKILELEAKPLSRSTSRKLLPAIGGFLAIIIGGTVLFKHWNTPIIKTVTAGAGFSVFARPEQDAQIITVVNAGEKFEVIVERQTKNWAFVRSRGKEGWVIAQDISVVSPIDIATGLGFRGPYWQLFFTAPQPKEGIPNQFGIDARFALAVGQCKGSLDIAVFEFNDKLITKAILDAHTRGVKVRIITDRSNLNSPPNRSTVDELRNAGIAVVVKNGGGHLMHCKFAIFDNATVWSGSWNYTDTGTFRNNENVAAIDSAEVAGAFAKKFQELFDDGSGRSKHPSEVVLSDAARFPHGIRVFFAPEDAPLTALGAILKEAKTSIQFMTLALSDADITETLRQQATNGVLVRGIVEKRLALMPTAKSLLTASVQNLDVRMDGNPRFLRHNCVIVDDRIVLLGSMNLSPHATTNDENLIVIPDAALAAKFDEEFERLWLISGKLEVETKPKSNDEEQAHPDD